MYGQSKRAIASSPRWRKHVWLASWLSSQLTVSIQKITRKWLLCCSRFSSGKAGVGRRSLLTCVCPRFYKRRHCFKRNRETTSEMSAATDVKLKEDWQQTPNYRQANSRGVFNDCVNDMSKIVAFVEVLAVWKMRPRTSLTSDPSPTVWFSCRNVFRVWDEPLRVRVRVSDVTARASAPRCFICLPLSPTPL